MNEMTPRPRGKIAMAPTTAAHETIEPTASTPWAKVMTDDEYFPFLAKKNLRPAIWRWREVEPQLKEVAKDPLKRADRRFLSLVSEDTGDAGGALPGVFIGLQIINPGEHIVPHRHTSYAIYHIVAGDGYSIVEGAKFEWTRGDTFICPPWALHEHVCTGDGQAVQYVIQDMPARVMERNLMWEEPIGRQFHMIKGAMPHSD